MQPAPACPGLAFVCGDAQSMPFSTSSFNAVVNIESSDLRSMDGVSSLREQFNACGLTDITTNVLTALRLDNARKLELIDAWIPRVFHRPFRVFAGIAGTRNYAGLEHGKLRYLSARLAKSSPADA